MRAVFIICFALIARLCAATYYVSTSDGNDADDGLSEANAFSTLEKLKSVFGTNDTGLLKRDDIWDVPSDGTNMFTFPANGTLSAYGTGRPPTLDLRGARHGVYTGGTATSTTTSNLRIINGGTASGALWEAQTVGSHILENCILAGHSFDAGAAASGDAHMIVRYNDISGCKDEGITQHTTTSSLIYGNYVHHNDEGLNNSGTDMAMTLAWNVFIDNNTAALGALGFTVATITGNYFGGRTDGSATTLFTGGDSAVTCSYNVWDGSHATSSTQPGINANCPITFYNDTFYGGAADHGAMSVSDTVVAVNCIAYNWTRFANILSGTFDIDHCLLFSVPNDATSSRTSNTNGLTSDPLFVEASGRNFTLQSTSPAINAGIPIAGLTTDHARNPINGLPDLGAYEYMPGGARKSRGGRMR